MSPNRALAYVDSSALVKLAVEEEESAALEAFLVDWPVRVTSVVADVEVHRAVRRAAAAAASRAAAVLELVNLIDLDRTILDTSRAIEPLELRSLDAIHLATALSLGTDLGPLVSYDRALNVAALGAGLDVASPA